MSPIPLAVRRRVGRPQSFTPLSIGWHTAFWASGPDFAALGIADGGAVATLPDETSTHDATQSTASKKPTYRAASANMNNRPIIEFDGVDDFLQTAAFTALAQPNELVVVARYRAIATDKYLCDARTTQSHIVNLSGGGGVQWNIYAGTNRQGGTSDTSKHLFRAVFDATDTLDVDGVNVVSANAGVLDTTGVSLGASVAGTNVGTVDIAFWGLSDILLTTQQRADLLAWSRSFYGTP